MLESKSNSKGVGDGDSIGTENLMGVISYASCARTEHFLRLFFWAGVGAFLGPWVTTQV